MGSFSPMPLLSVGGGGRIGSIAFLSPPSPYLLLQRLPLPPSHCFISASQAHGRVPRRPIGTDLRFHFFLSQYLILAGQPEHLQGLRMHLFLFLSEETRL